LLNCMYFFWISKKHSFKSPGYSGTLKI
jgi:hypothetical protein